MPYDLLPTIVYGTLYALIWLNPLPKSMIYLLWKGLVAIELQLGLTA